MFEKIITMVFSFVAGAAALYGVFAWTEGDHAFKGLDLAAEVNAQAQPRLFIPDYYDKQPNEIFARGSVTSISTPGSLPKPFKVRLSQIDAGLKSGNRIILLQDVRPLVCDILDQQNCSDYEIVNLVIEAHFSRGPKPATVEKLSPIVLEAS